MKIRTEQMSPGIVKIAFVGRMDTAGTNEIEKLLADITSQPDLSFIVDMSSVDFLASLGIRTLLLNAREVNRKGQKFVVLKPTHGVASVLKSAGIDSLIPVFTDSDLALAACTDNGLKSVSKNG
jgi:anti-anti-sigma factor